MILPRQSDLGLARTAIEATIRVGLLLALVGWCFWIASPFIAPLLWGTIIAIALFPGFLRLRGLLGGRDKLAALLLTLLGLVLLIGPLGFLALSLIDSVALVAGRLGGGVTIPPPPDQVVGLPLIGEPLGKLWTLASINLGEALAKLAPQLRIVAAWLLALVANVGISFVIFLVAIVVAGLLLANWRVASERAEAIAIRLAGERGGELLGLAEQTIRNVTRGLLGTAMIQATLAGVGFAVMGVPAAALLALICFLLCVVQVGPILVLVPALAWAFFHTGTLAFVLFVAWCLLVALIDNFLRPYLMSRGAGVPLLVILIGVLGGLLAHGLIGLFIGPIVLALGYTLTRAWIDDGTRAPPRLVEAAPAAAIEAVPPGPLTSFQPPP